MSGLVTAPPSLIDPTTFARFTATIGAGQCSIKFGPFLWNGFLYIVQQDNTADGLIGVFQSPATDGLIYTRVGVASQPPYNTGGFAQFDASTGIIHLVYQNDSNSLAFFNTFDCAALSYGAEVSTNLIPANMGWGISSFARLSNGDEYVYCIQVTGGTPGVDHLNLKYIKFSGGVVSGPITVDSFLLTASSELTTFCTYVDPLNRMGVVYVYWPNYGAGSGSMYYRQVSATGVVSGATLIETFTGIQAFGSGLAQVNGDSVLMPMNTTVPRVLIGTTLAAPTWAFVNPDPGAVLPASATTLYNWSIIVPDKDGNPTYFVITQDPNIPLDQCWMIRYIGAMWQIPILFQNSVLNPPLNSGVAFPVQNQHGSDALQLPNGAWVFITAYEFVSPPGDEGIEYCAGFALTTTVAPSAAVPINPGPAGRRPIVLIPNQFDHCLHREYRLFCDIDYDAKGCARLPKCFTVDEREWGEQSYP